MPISIYFLPRFSGLKEPVEIKKLMRSCFVFSLPVLTLFGSLVFLFKGPIVDLLFSSEFTSVKGLIGVLLIAELFRVTAGVFGVFFIANKLLYKNIRNESLWAAIFVIGVLLSFSGYGLKGVVVSYLISCSVWFLLNFMGFLSILRTLQKNNLSQLNFS
jgi:O-antigen/teichoic acid export membrane protein